MPSRNVALQKSIYDALLREKRYGESFTAVIRRLLERPGSVDDLVGIWGGATARADLLRLRRLREAGPRR